MICFLCLHLFYVIAEISCGTPQREAFSTNRIVGLGYGDNTTYDCMYGYQYIGGDTVHQCKANGDWHGDPIQCQGKPSILAIITKHHLYKMTYEYNIVCESL